MDTAQLTASGFTALDDGRLAIEPNQVLSEPVPNEDGLPEWIQLTPGGNRFAGRDGRAFRIRSPRQLVREFNRSGEDLQMDIDHASEFGLGSEASAWLVDMELRANAEIWGRVEWTPQGAALVTDRVFRGISPTFTVDRESVMKFLEDPSKPMEITGFQSVALTNRPNLSLRSLNTEQTPTEETQTMDTAKLLAALGLADTASEADILQAIGGLKSDPAPEPNAALPDLDKYVPRTDLAQMQSQLAEANAKLQAQAEAQHNAAVDTTIREAIKAGKLAPASEGFYREVCSTPVGLAKTKTHLASAPTIVAPNTTITPVEGSSRDASGGLTDGQKHLCKMWGFTAKQYHESRAQLVEEGKLEG